MLVVKSIKTLDALNMEVNPGCEQKNLNKSCSAIISFSDLVTDTEQMLHAFSVLFPCLMKNVK